MTIYAAIACILLLVLIGLAAMTGGTLRGIVPGLLRRFVCNTRGHRHGVVSKAGSEVYVSDCRRCGVSLIKRGKDARWERRPA